MALSSRERVQIGVMSISLSAAILFIFMHCRQERSAANIISCSSKGCQDANGVAYHLAPGQCSLALALLSSPVQVPISTTTITLSGIYEGQLISCRLETN